VLHAGCAAAPAAGVSDHAIWRHRRSGCQPNAEAVHHPAAVRAAAGPAREHPDHPEPAEQTGAQQPVVITAMS
jgi:hypothetical protein